MKRYRLPLLAALVAIAVTTTMDFTGLFLFSALPLFGIGLAFWLIKRLSVREMGLRWGAGKYYGLALLYPVVVLGVIVLLAIATDNFDPQQEGWSTLLKNMGIGLIVGTLMVLLTEEGFFRGWLWGAFQKEGMDEKTTLWVTSGLFTIWHISAVTSGTDYGLPLYQVPIYLTNAMLLGLIWGTLRLLSGSVIVAAFCHALWNPLAYELFGFGEKIGALGITNTIVYGPEVGVLGIVLNGLFFLLLWSRYKNKVLAFPRKKSKNPAL